MGKNLREEMPWTAALIDDLRAAFGKDVIDGQIRRGLKGEPVFWVRENGHELGTRGTVQTSVVYWDERGISRSRPAAWILDARAMAHRDGVVITPADPADQDDVEREAAALRRYIEKKKSKGKGQ